MKMILLAAAAVIAAPAIAQTTTTPMPDQSQTMQNGQTMPAQSGQTMPMTAQTTGDPAGGYAPTQPALSGTPMPGQTVTYQQAPTPSQAFPPPPAPTGPLPWCKAGQYNNCREHENAAGQGVRKHHMKH